MIRWFYLQKTQQRVTKQQYKFVFIEKFKHIHCICMCVCVNVFVLSLENKFLLNNIVVILRLVFKKICGKYLTC